MFRYIQCLVCSQHQAKLQLENYVQVGIMAFDECQGGFCMQDSWVIGARLLFNASHEQTVSCLVEDSPGSTTMLPGLAARGDLCATAKTL